MIESNTYKTVCPFCGKAREVTTVHDDGVDFYGHARGKSYEKTTDEGCTCELGKLEHNPQKLKKMCKNCKHNESSYCKNEKVVDEVSGMFYMPDKLEIKDDTKKCDEWKLNTELFRCLVQLNYYLVEVRNDSGAD